MDGLPPHAFGARIAMTTRPAHVRNNETRHRAATLVKTEKCC
jgi:hypothetical protein